MDRRPQPAVRSPDNTVAKTTHAAQPAIVVRRFALEILAHLGVGKDEEALLPHPRDDGIRDVLVTTPLGAAGRVEGDEIVLDAALAEPAGVVRTSVRGSDPLEVAKRAAAELGATVRV